MGTRKLQVAAGLLHLQRTAPRLKPVISAAGPFNLAPRGDRFGMLVRSIVGQQISTGAARAIYGRLQSLRPRFSAEAVLSMEDDELRGAGLSSQKIVYIRDLSERVASGHLRLDQIGRLDDAAIIERLIEVKGIGRWTAQMFLIFALCRLDVFPEDDLGIRSALRNLYGLEGLPDRKTAREIAAPWSPFATMGSWYLWRSLELDRGAAPVNFWC